MDNKSFVEGVIDNVVFSSPSTGYSVLEVETEDGTATVVGCLPFAGVAERVYAEGAFVTHASYGVQFKAEHIDAELPSTAEAIRRYLDSGAIKGVGPVTAKRLVEEFGDRTLDVILNDPGALLRLRGVTRAKAREISEGFGRFTALRALMTFLDKYGFEGRLAMPLFAKYGYQASETLLANPYIIMDEAYGVGFARADAFAEALGMEGDDPRRLEACIRYALMFNLYEGGHVFLPEDKLLQSAAALGHCEPERLEPALARLGRDGLLIKSRVMDIDVWYIREYFMAETYVAERMLALAKAEYDLPGGFDAIAAAISDSAGVAYSPRQLECLRMAAAKGVFILTGGPGTGKSTTVMGIIKLYEEMGIKTALAAPTGRAAKRLTELTGREAKTIHRLLEPAGDGALGAFARNRENTLPVGAVILDETSMVDIRLFASLLEAMEPGARLVLIGDSDQLPPVGPGSPLRDLLLSEKVAAVHLDEIFRQAQGSNIVMGAHSVNRGELPNLGSKQGDFFFLPRSHAAEAADTIIELCKTRLPERQGIDPSRIQVISPMRKGEAGVHELNAALQAALNPPSAVKRERKHMNAVFREGDRVMQIKNNYQLPWQKEDGSEAGLGVFNGDVGVVREIRPQEEYVTVTFDDRVCTYPFDALDQLELSYAITVHKSQGSEFDAVIFSAAQHHSRLSTRRLLYTGMTRARKLLIIVGREDVLQAMAGNAQSARRYTGLRARLIGRCEDAESG